MEDCIFCKIVSGEIKTDFLYEDDNFVVINDSNPATEGHCLVIPKKHYKTLFDLSVFLGNNLLEIAKAQGLRLIKEGKAEGIKLVQNNYEASGQEVKHFHLHIIPEKKGVDTRHV